MLTKLQLLVVKAFGLVVEILIARVVGVGSAQHFGGRTVVAHFGIRIFGAWF
jgi:hypothetical protein